MLILDFLQQSVNEGGHTYFQLHAQRTSVIFNVELCSKRKLWPRYLRWSSDGHIPLRASHCRHARVFSRVSREFDCRCNRCGFIEKYYNHRGDGLQQKQQQRGNIAASASTGNRIFSRVLAGEPIATIGGRPIGATSAAVRRGQHTLLSRCYIISGCSGSLSLLRDLVDRLLLARTHTNAHTHRILNSIISNSHADVESYNMFVFERVQRISA